MTHLEFLRNGTAAHRVEVRSPNLIEIFPVSQNEKDKAAFQQVVADALVHSHEGYKVLPHQDDMEGSRRIYDFATITW